MISAGFANRCITPPMGAAIPGLFELRSAAGVADDLFVRAVVIAQGRGIVALVQVDAIVTPDALVAAARRRIARSTLLPPGAVMIAATHTHSGGPVCDLFSTPANKGYITTLVRAIAESVIEACNRLQPCFVGTSISHAPGVAFNRRFIMKDGSQATHPGKMNPQIRGVAGPAEDTVTTVGFRDAKTFRPLGCIVNFACHATHMNGVAFSADYPKWVIDTLQSAYGKGFATVFLNAPCGDVTQMDNLSPRPFEFGPYWCERTGRAVGGAALQGLATMNYLRDASVDVESEQLRAAIRLSTKAELRQAGEIVAKAGRGAMDAEALYARERLAVHAMREKAPRRILEIQAMRIADALFWTVPGELFQALALEVRAQSPFAKTCGVTLANGYHGYLCTPEAYLGGGYEVRLARSSLLVPSTGPRVSRMALGLAKRLHRRARPELDGLAIQYTWPTIADTALDGMKALETRRRE